MGANAITNCSTLNQMRAGERVYKFAQAVPNSTAVFVAGMLTVFPQGTATVRPASASISTLSVFRESDRTGMVSAATAGASAQFRFEGTVYRPHAAGRGGFDVTMRVGASDAAAVADARCFYGFAAAVSTAQFANANPSTFFNILGIGADSKEANLSIMANAGTGVATKIALGAAFPANTLSVDLYEIRFSCLPGVLTTILYEITNQTTGAFVSGTLTATLPVAGVALEPTAWRNNGTTLLAVGVDLAQVTMIKFV